MLFWLDDPACSTEPMPFADLVRSRIACCGLRLTSEMGDECRCRDNDAKAIIVVCMHQQG